MYEIKKCVVFDTKKSKKQAKRALEMAANYGYVWPNQPHHKNACEYATDRYDLSSSFTGLHFEVEGGPGGYAKRVRYITFSLDDKASYAPFPLDDKECVPIYRTLDKLEGYFGKLIEVQQYNFSRVLGGE